LLAAALVAAACASGCASGLAETQVDALRASDIRALRWAAVEADKVKFLTTRPAPCYREPPTFKDIGLYRLGRLAFESPALLGGAAGRMGLSCSSCHLNGRGNPDFFIEGVSDKPGTADVTSSIFSKVRGDQTFNPVPIPDLAAKDGKQIKDRKGADFRAKVHGLVVEEFDGQQPPSEIFRALLYYLDAQDISACADPGASVAVTWRADWDDVVMAIFGAQELFENGLTDDARFLTRAIRDRLGRLHERFIAAHQGHSRNELVKLSRLVETWASLPPDSAEWEQAADGVFRELRQTAFAIEASANRSLYNPEVLRAALADR
jgi:hypothetical protein